jgi:flagellar export protein FliJ
MAFRFSLDAVLRFRQSVEHSEEAVLHRIVQDIAGVEMELQQADEKQTRLRAQREQNLTHKLPAVHLLEIAEREMELKKVADGLRSRLRQLETQRVKQLAIYQTAHRDRQVLSELREQQRRVYQLNQRRQEQKMLDDLFLARRRPGD